jgi:hypothetical protein
LALKEEIGREEQSLNSDLRFKHVKRYKINVFVLRFLILVFRFSIFLASTACQTVILVENAGTSLVNGVYEFSEMKNNGGVFSRKVTLRNKEVLFSISKLQGVYNSLSWVISSSSGGSEGGNTDSIVLYSVSGSSYEIQPRTDIKWSGCCLSLNPPPTLVIYNNFNEFGEDDSSSQVTADRTTALFRDSLLKDLTISYGEETFLASFRHVQITSNKWWTKNGEIPNSVPFKIFRASNPEISAHSSNTFILGITNFY